MMKYVTNLPLFLVLALVFAISAGCGGVNSGEDAGTPASDEPTVKRLANLETGVSEAKPPDPQKQVASAKNNSAEKSNSAEKNRGSSAAVEQNSTAQAKRGKARASEKSGKANGRAGSNSGEGAGGTGKVRLKIGGEPGTEFSGTCTVGGGQQDISGQVPERYDYELDGETLKCEIDISGSGALEATFTAEGGRQVQKVRVTGGTLNISYSGNGLSSASSSVSSVSGSSQQSVISSSSSSN